MRDRIPSGTQLKARNRFSYIFPSWKEETVGTTVIAVVDDTANNQR